MRAVVRIPTMMTKYSDGRKVLETSGETIGEVLTDLSSSAADLVGVLYREGDLSRFMNLYLNGKDVRSIGGLTAVVRDGDEITIIPALAGG